jgi:outer membrane murein-binding lipoprotein Lpp
MAHTKAKRKYTKRYDLPFEKDQKISDLKTEIARLNNDVNFMGQAVVVANQKREYAVKTIDAIYEAIAQNSRSLDLVTQAAHNNAQQARDFMAFLNIKKELVSDKQNVVDMSSASERGRAKYGS